MIDFCPSQHYAEAGPVWSSHTYAAAGYNRPKSITGHLTFVDNEKAFDFIDNLCCPFVSPAMPNRLSIHQSLEVLYQNAITPVRVQDWTTNPNSLQPGVRQGDVMSPKLFTAALENVFWIGMEFASMHIHEVSQEMKRSAGEPRSSTFPEGLPGSSGSDDREQISDLPRAG